jgi:hypothetical protein
MRVYTRNEMTHDRPHTDAAHGLPLPSVVRVPMLAARRLGDTVRHLRLQYAADGARARRGR